MKVVVCGATGNVGSAVVRELARDPAVDEIVGIARRCPDTTTEKTRYVARDLRGDDLAGELRGADVAFHLAWFFQPTHRPLVTWSNNVGGTEHLLAAIARAEVPALVYASSVGAYSPAPGRTVDESWPTDSLPTAGYGREKAYVERLLDRFEAAHPSVRVVRFRPSFMFQRSSASEQRRIFAGPMLPGSLVPWLPVLPYPRGLRFQVLHTEDAATAFCRGATRDVRGAFNLASSPVVTGDVLAEALGARLVEVPPGVVRAALAALWHARLAPAEPALFDLVMPLPILDCTRARTELGWEPQWSAREVLDEFVRGLARGEGAPTPPLEPDRPATRVREAVGIGSRVEG